MTDKIVILAGGKGSRMQADDQAVNQSDLQASVASTGIKALVPVGRPFIDYVLANVAEAGFRDVCLIIGPGHNALRDHCATLNPQRLNIEFAIQEEPLGTANALLAAEAFAGDDEFVMINSDNCYPVQALQQIRTCTGAATVGYQRDALIKHGNIPSERVMAFAVIQSDDTGNFFKVIEKPDKSVMDQLPEPILVSMNCWRFSKNIFEAARCIEPSQRGEYEIPAAVMYCVDQLEESFHVIPSAEPVIDLSNRQDFASAEQMLASIEVQL